ncbi:thioredoxin family protein [Neobacillus mesonae]|nr:thioredoxin family protein [Neobacillus mesonae]
MIETSEQEILRMAWEGQAFALFIYTPLCGTCHAARRMLEVCEHLLPAEILYEANITQIQGLVQQYQIRSVPAVLLFSGEKALPKHVYRMESVEHLLAQIRRVIK